MVETSHAETQARAQVESIRALLACLRADRERLIELRDAKASWDPEHDALHLPDNDNQEPIEWAAANPDDADELAALEAAVRIDGDELTEEEAQERIYEDPLSVLVRSDWHEVGGTSYDAEFEILLCTGGPACRIVGALDRGQPMDGTIRVEYQDWGTPWVEYYPGSEALSDVLDYCNQFYYGE